MKWTEKVLKVFEEVTTTESEYTQAVYSDDNNNILCMRSYKNKRKFHFYKYVENDWIEIPSEEFYFTIWGEDYSFCGISTFTEDDDEINTYDWKDIHKKYGIIL